MNKFFTVGLTLLAGSILTMPVALAKDSLNPSSSLDSLNASPSIVGNWKVTFYLEPTRATGATQCIVFTLEPGRVAGVPTSGTWRSPTFPTWHGEWIQVGDHVRWFGVTGNLATEASGDIAYKNIFGGVSFNHFSVLDAKTSSAGSWRGLRTASCTGEMPNTTGNDPAN